MYVVKALCVCVVCARVCVCMCGVCACMCICMFVYHKIVSKHDTYAVCGNRDGLLHEYSTCMIAACMMHDCMPPSTHMTVLQSDCRPLAKQETHGLFVAHISSQMEGGDAVLSWLVHCGTTVNQHTACWQLDMMQDVCTEHHHTVA